MVEEVTLNVLYPLKGKSLNPANFEEEIFELYSIGAYDNGTPDILKGKEIGSSKKVLQPNDIILSRIVPHIQRCWVVPEKKELEQIGSGEWIVFRSSKVFPDYLRYFLISKPFHSMFMSTVKGVGGSLLRADPEQVGRFKIPLPPKAMQKSITQILDHAIHLRDRTQKVLEEYDLLAQAIFLEMFGDPAINQKGWEVKLFGDVGILDRGKSKHRPRNAPELLGGKYPLIQTGDIANSGGYIENYKSTYSEIGLAQSKMWPKGTLCITVAANIAKTGILKIDACFPDSVVGFMPNEFTNNEFTQFWMSFLQKIIEANAPESAQKNINLKILRELEFYCPPVILQNRFAEKIVLIEKQKDLAKQELQESEDFFDCLLQKAFKGELVN